MLQIGVRIMTTEHIDDSFWSLGFRKGVCVVLELFTESRRSEKHSGWIPCCIVPRRFVGRIGDIQLQREPIVLRELLLRNERLQHRRHLRFKSE